MKRITLIYIIIIACMVMMVLSFIGMMMPSNSSNQIEFCLFSFVGWSLPACAFLLLIKHN